MNTITFFIALLVILLIVAIIMVGRSRYQIHQLKTAIVEHKNKREEFALLIDKVNQSSEKNTFDEKTSLLGREGFDEYFSNLILQSKRFNNLFATVILEINGLQNVRDTSEKNSIFVQIARQIKNSIRDTDVACLDTDSTFLLLLPNMLKPEIIVHAIDRIIQSITMPINSSGTKIELSINIGISIFPFDGETKEILLEHARVALEKARKNGKNIFQFYQEETQSLGDRELSLKSAIKSETFLNYLKLEYKTYIDAGDNKIAFIDVTSAFNHPEIGLISFDDLIAASQSASKLYVLYEWMMMSAIKKFNFPDDNNLSEKNRFIFTFNLKQLETPQFLEKIIDLIKKFSSEKNEIIMRMKDDGIENIDPELLRKSIARLNEFNIPISIGILVLGHFAIKKINLVTFNYLQIDEKLIKDLSDRQESQLIIGKIMLLANSLKIGTMTAGVDTSEKMMILKSLGCMIMEGAVFNTTDEIVE